MNKLTPKAPEVDIMWHASIRQSVNFEKQLKRVVVKGQECLHMRGRDLSKEVNGKFYFECNSFHLTLGLRMDPFLYGSNGKKLI